MKILVIQTSFPGDAILSLPFLQELHKRNPEATIDIVATPANKEIFLSSPVVQEVFVLDKRGSQKKIHDTILFAKELHKKKYNTLYALHRSFRTAILSYFVNAEKSIGFSNASMKFIYDETVPYLFRKHEAERNLAFLKEAISEIPLPLLQVNDEQRERLGKLLPMDRKRIIAVAPSSQWETKKYPFEHFRKIIEFLLNKNYNIIILGSASEREYCDKLISGTDAINLAGLTSFSESRELLTHCSLLISNDSSAAHLGVSANIPVLMIYCSTVPEFGFYPYHSKGSYISYDKLQCKPCGIHGHKECPLRHFHCGKLLDPAEILVKAEAMIEQD